MTKEQFEQMQDKLFNSVFHNLIKEISNYGFTIPYESQLQIPQDFIIDIWESIDQDSLKQKIKERLEKELADRIINQIAREISTDIKKVLSNENNRETIRQKAQEIIKEMTKNEG